MHMWPAVAIAFQCFVSFNSHHSMVFYFIVFSIWFGSSIVANFVFTCNFKTHALDWHDLLHISVPRRLPVCGSALITLYHNSPLFTITQDFELSDLHHSGVLRATERRRSFVGAACRISMAKTRLEQLKPRYKLVSNSPASARSSTIQLQTTTTISKTRESMLALITNSTCRIVIGFYDQTSVTYVI